jgi:hypothetical protein
MDTTHPITKMIVMIVTGMPIGTIRLSTSPLPSATQGIRKQGMFP